MSSRMYGGVSRATGRRIPYFPKLYTFEIDRDSDLNPMDDYQFRIVFTRNLNFEGGFSENKETFNCGYTCKNDFTDLCITIYNGETMGIPTGSTLKQFTEGYSLGVSSTIWIKLPDSQPNTYVVSMNDKSPTYSNTIPYTADVYADDMFPEFWDNFEDNSIDGSIYDGSTHSCDSAHTQIWESGGCLVIYGEGESYSHFGRANIKTKASFPVNRAVYYNLKFEAEANYTNYEWYVGFGRTFDIYDCPVNCARPTPCVVAGCWNWVSADNGQTLLVKPTISTTYGIRGSEYDICPTDWESFIVGRATIENNTVAYCKNIIWDTMMTSVTIIPTEPLPIGVWSNKGWGSNWEQITIHFMALTNFTYPVPYIKEWGYGYPQ